MARYPECDDLMPNEMPDTPMRKEVVPAKKWEKYRDTGAAARDYDHGEVDRVVMGGYALLFPTS